MKVKRVYAIVPAAGMGRRMGGYFEPDGPIGVKKQFLPLHGVPLLVHTLTRFQQSPRITQIIPVVPQDDLASVTALLSEYAFSKVTPVLPGGATRQDSVQAGITFLEQEATPDDIILVHDGVRPFVSPSLIAQVIAAAEKFGGAAAALPITDSLARVSPAHLVEESVSRTYLWAMQTPQAFRYKILSAACRQATADGFYATDETALVTRIGQPVHCVEGSAENIKITTPADWAAAERWLSKRVPQP